MLKYTLGILPPNVGGSSDWVPSALKKKQGHDEDLDSKVAAKTPHLDGIERTLENANLLAAQLQNLTKTRLAQNQELIERGNRNEIRDLEREIERFEDRMFETTCPEHKQLFQTRINHLKNKIGELV